MALDRQEYVRVQMLAVTLGQETAKLPLEDVLAQITAAESAAPTLDPTLWRAGHKQLSRFKELATALLAVKRVSERHLKIAMEEQAAAWTREDNFTDQAETN